MNNDNEGSWEQYEWINNLINRGVEILLKEEWDEMWWLGERQYMEYNRITIVVAWIIIHLLENEMLKSGLDTLNNKWMKVSTAQGFKNKRNNCIDHKRDGCDKVKENIIRRINIC